VKDWRGHVDEMHSHQKSIEDALKETSSQLTRLHDDIHRTLEKVTSRENYLNNHLDQPLSSFRTMQDHLAEVKEQYRQASGGVTERTRSLTEVCIRLLSFWYNTCRAGLSSWWAPCQRPLGGPSHSWSLAIVLFDKP